MSTHTANITDEQGERPGSSPDQVEEQRLPLAHEVLTVRRETRDTGRVRIRKQVHERIEHVNEPLVEEEVEVRRVPVDRVLNEPAQIRHEGDVLIIPVMEERLVLSKELVLTEELHVRKHRHETREERAVTLHSEKAVVERLAPGGDTV